MSEASDGVVGRRVVVAGRRRQRVVDVAMPVPAPTEMPAGLDGRQRAVRALDRDDDVVRD